MQPGYTVLVAKSHHVHPCTGWIPVLEGQVVEPDDVDEMMDLLRKWRIPHDFDVVTFESREAMLEACVKYYDGTLFYL